MVAQVLNTIGVMHVPVIGQYVLGAQPVLHDEERLAVTVVQLHKRDLQSRRIGLPAPFGAGQVGILDTVYRIVG